VKDEAEALSTMADGPAVLSHFNVVAAKSSLLVSARDFRRRCADAKGGVEAPSRSTVAPIELSPNITVVAMSSTLVSMLGATRTNGPSNEDITGGVNALSVATTIGLSTPSLAAAIDTSSADVSSRAFKRRTVGVSGGVRDVSTTCVLTTLSSGLFVVTDRPATGWMVLQCCGVATVVAKDTIGCMALQICGETPKEALRDDAARGIVDLCEGGAEGRTPASVMWPGRGKELERDLTGLELR